LRTEPVVTIASVANRRLMSFHAFGVSPVELLLSQLEISLGCAVIP
jgi:hypothetical protein